MLIKIDRKLSFLFDVVVVKVPNKVALCKVKNVTWTSMTMNAATHR
jgi:hypothetical protein